MPNHLVRGLRAERVYLRPLEPDDADLVHRWYEDERVRLLMGDPPISLARRRQRYADSVGEADGVFRFLICLLADDSPVGRTDIFDLDPRNGSAAFGITIGNPEDWGQGLGTDALSAITDFAFGELRLERLWLDTDAENLRAQAAYRKAGFVQEGRLRHSWFGEGRYGDEIRMSMLREEWLALPRRRTWDLVAEAAGEDPSSQRQG